MIKRISKTFSVPRNMLDVHFGIILKSSHRRSAFLAVHLPLCAKNTIWNIIAIYLKRNIQNFFFDIYIYLMCSTLQHSFNYCYQFFVSYLIRIKINVLLILWFSVYRCRGNIDFSKNHITQKFNLSPVTGMNFTSIRFLNSLLKKIGRARQELY